MRRLNARIRVDSKSKKMDPIKLQIRPSTRPNLFSRNSKPTKSNYMVLASIFIALAFFLCYLFVFGRNSQNVVKKKYGIVIDGGSTGTRIHVFTYRVEGGNAVFDFGKDGLASMRVNPGLSSYAEEPNGVRESLAELLEFGKSRVPKENWGDTEIRLMATAGLRMLELGVQERILESCRRVLWSSGFKFRDGWASIITGSDEGLYAWVIANYALGTLGGDPLHTTGIIELGGASVQVTFVSSELLPYEFLHAVRFGNTTYNIYSHSFLHFGQNVAFDSLREALISEDVNSAAVSLQKGLLIDPCTPKGYSHNIESWNPSPGSLGLKNRQSTLETRGNFTECRSAALMLLQKGKEECSYQHCYIGSTFIPKLQGKFLATENFFHTSKFFGLRPRAFLSDLMIAGQQFCGEDWSRLRKMYQSLHEEDLLRYCFSSAYIVAMLHDSFGIVLDDERVVAANQLGNIPLDWALGAFILQSTVDLDVKYPDWIATVISDDSPALLTLVGIFIILMFTAWSVSRCKKPQLKTIYDLEKGRYIVTRVGRS